MAALNACMMIGYVAGAAVKGISLEKLEIETHGEVDLRGFRPLDLRQRKHDPYGTERCRLPP